MKKDQIYIAPEMEIVNIEVEQAILQASPGSVEDLGDWLDEMGW